MSAITKMLKPLMCFDQFRTKHVGLLRTNINVPERIVKINSHILANNSKTHF